MSTQSVTTLFTQLADAISELKEGNVTVYDTHVKLTEIAIKLKQAAPEGVKFTTPTIDELTALDNINYLSSSSEYQSSYQSSSC